MENMENHARISTFSEHFETSNKYKNINTLFIGIEYGFLLIESSESVSTAQTSFLFILKFQTFHQFTRFLM